MRCHSSVLILVTLAFAANLTAQSKPEAPEYEIKEHYTKYEFRIPMRDGVHLFTSVYVPKDSSRAYPFLNSLQRRAVWSGSLPQATRTIARLR